MSCATPAGEAADGIHLLRLDELQLALAQRRLSAPPAALEPLQAAHRQADDHRPAREHREQIAPEARLALGEVVLGVSLEAFPGARQGAEIPVVRGVDGRTGADALARLVGSLARPVLSLKRCSPRSSSAASLRKPASASLPMCQPASSVAAPPRMAPASARACRIPRQTSSGSTRSPLASCSIHRCVVASALRISAALLTAPRSRWTMRLRAPSITTTMAIDSSPSAPSVHTRRPPGSPERDGERGGAAWGCFTRARP
jgi:hypothetical protein